MDSLSKDYVPTFEEVIESPSSSKSIELSTLLQWFSETNIVSANIDFERTPEADKKGFIIYGRPQGGKTNNIIACCHLSELHGISNVVILPNSREGWTQFQERVHEYNTACAMYCLRNKKRVYKEVELLFLGNYSSRKRKDFLKALSGEEPRTIVVLSNKCELSRLEEMIEEVTLSTSARPRYNIVIDEADAAYKQDVEEYSQVFDSVLDSSERIVGVSATTFRLWFLEGRIHTTNIVVLPIHRDYRGVKDFVFSPVPDECRAATRKEHVMAFNMHFEEYMHTLSEKDIYRYTDLVTGEQSSHPHMLLFRCSEKLNEHHEQALEWVKDHCVFGEKWTGIIFNGDGIAIWDHRLSQMKTLHINGEKSHRSSGIHRLEKTSLRHVLEWLRINGGAEVFSHIIIISGRLVNRMISFVSSSYKWHLTNLYLILNNKTLASGCDDLIQMCRLCGIYPHDRIPLEMACHQSVYNDILRADKLQDEIITSALGVDKTLQDHIEDSQMEKSSMPRQRLTRGVPYQLNIIVDHRSTDLTKVVRIDEERLAGKMEKQIYKGMVECISTNWRKGEWVLKGSVVNLMVDTYEYARDRDQVNGNLNSMLRNKSSNVSEISGLCFQKIGEVWYIRVD